MIDGINMWLDLITLHYSLVCEFQTLLISTFRRYEPLIATHTTLPDQLLTSPLVSIRSFMLHVMNRSDVNWRRCWTRPALLLLANIVDLHCADTNSWPQRTLPCRISCLHHHLSGSVHLCFTLRTVQTWAEEDAEQEQRYYSWQRWLNYYRCTTRK